MRLAKTLVIKYVAEAESLNDYIRLKYGAAMVMDEYPETWKYYLNLAGEYHPVDTTMTVVSLDTQQEIVFNKENLDKHSATKLAYQYGSRYHDMLLSSYPDQETLIRGILLPVDIQKAISAKDFEILGWQTDLVEPQETNLIDELQAHIDRFVGRWCVQAFNLSDNYYNLAFFAYLIYSIPAKIQNIRLNNIRTKYAHSFHIREYLASNWRLDQNFQSLTHKQKMWLYKNIPRLEEDLGKSKQFKELTDVLLTDRSIPLTGFVIRQENKFDANLDPEIHVYRDPINTVQNANGNQTLSLDQLVEKESVTTYGNPKHHELEKAKVLEAVKTTDSAVTRTKDLESAMVDYSDAFPETRQEVYLREWAYLAMTGRYLAYIRFQDPKTGEPRALRADDAITYMQLATLKTLGVDIDKVPNIFVWRHRLQKKATVEELMSVTTGRFNRQMREYAQSVFDLEDEVEPFVSVSSFNAYAEKQFQNTKKYWMLSSFEEDHRIHGELKNLINRNYGCTFFEREAPSLNEWLTSCSLPAYDLTTEQSNELIAGIFQAATGYKFDDMSPVIVQKAMIETILKLLSYSVQIITEINNSSIVPLNWSAIRTSIPDIETESDLFLPIPLGPVTIDASTNSEIKVPLSLSMDCEVLFVETNSVIDHPLELSMTMDTDSTGETIYLNHGINVMGVSYPGYIQSVSERASYYGSELFMALTEEQKRELLV